MSIMVVGADHLGHIKKNLQAWGFERICHITCRESGDPKKLNISARTSLVVVLTDYVNHGAARYIKEQAKSQGVPMVFAKRSWVSVAEQLEKLGV